VIKGILGETLASCGYNDLTGIDLSRAMLDVAQKRGIYNDLQQMVLGEHLDFSDNYFSAVVSKGVFTENHAPPESFDELIRVAKPGGYIIFSVRSDTDLNKVYKEKQDALLHEKKWELIEETRAFQCLPEASPEVLNQVFVYRVS
jgi:ubiquinone/menaquinone biosynthesis C-methylase UbiE